MINDKQSGRIKMNQSEYYLYTLHLSVWIFCYGHNIQECCQESFS